MNHPDALLIIARDLHRERLDEAARIRLARAARGRRARRGWHRPRTWTDRRPVGAQAAQLEPC